MTSADSPFATPTERLATYFNCAQPRNTFEDRDIDDIATLLEQCGHIASKCPRTYILFRTIGQLEAVERLVNAGFSDQFFPVEARNLPTFLDLTVIQAVVQRQGIILTKSLDLENGRHRHFTPGEALPFEILGRLGSGGYGQVDRILSRTSFKQYALKRIRRRAAFGNTSSREAVRGFINEMKILRNLEHRHIIQYIGSYTDKSYLGLVMSPVADTDLASYSLRLCAFLQAIEADKSSTYSQDRPVAAEMASTLRTFYGCLTAALGHLHEQSIRHKDIKPQNILVAKGNVLLTDFGLSRDFADDVGSTTSGVTPASARYCAPEVASYEARNTSSDIWSLGCVFIEMTAALQGWNVEGIKQSFLQNGSEGTHFHNNPAATAKLIEKLNNTGDPRDQRTLAWIEKMVVPQKGQRLTAAQVIEMITSSQIGDIEVAPNMFCGICCVPDLESDSLDSLEDDFDAITAISPPNHSYKRGSTQEPQIVDHQPVVQTTTKSKINDKTPAQSTYVSGTAPSRSAESSASNVPRTEAELFASASPWVALRRTLQGNKSKVAPTSAPQIQHVKANIDPKLLLETSVSANESTVSNVSSFAKGQRSSQSSTAIQVGVPTSPGGRPGGSNANVDFDEVEYRLRMVFGKSILHSIEYAYHELGSWKTVGGATISGRIPTIIFNCSNLAASLYGKEKFLRRPGPSLAGRYLLQLNFQYLVPLFNLDDNYQGYIEPRLQEDQVRILHAYLLALPKPIVPWNTMDRILQILSSPETQEEKQRGLQIILLQLRPPYCLSWLFILDTFAACVVACPESRAVIVDTYYSSLFGMDTASLKLGEGEKKYVLQFMIDNAKYLLGGPIAGETISKNNELLLQKITGDRGVAQSDNRDATSTRDQMQARRKSSASDVDALEASPRDAELLIRGGQLIVELLAEGITDHQITNFAWLIDAYVNQSPYLQITGCPLWLTTRFAGVERSTHDDLKTRVDYRCVVPIFVAQCCQGIVSHTEFLLNNPYHEPEHILQMFCTNPDTPLSDPLLSMFEEHPHFGRDLPRQNRGMFGLAQGLFTYLSSLPEPIISHDVLRDLVSWTELRSVQKLAQYIAKLPKPNHETLIYLLLFLNKITDDRNRSKIAEIFLPVLLGANYHDIKDGTNLIWFLIQNVAYIIRKTPGATHMPLGLGSELTPPKLENEPSYRDLVVARYQHEGAYENGYLSFREGDVIEVITRRGNRYDLWKGEIRGEIGLFPGGYTRPFDAENPRDRDHLSGQPNSSRSAKTDRAVRPNTLPTPRSGSRVEEPRLGHGFRNALNGLFKK